MKRNLFALIATLVFAMAITNETIAQGSTSKDAYEGTGNIVKVQELMAAENSIVITDEIGAKAITDFKKSYKIESNVQWFKNEFGYIAQFASHGINTVVYYDKKGKWKASIKSYSEEKFDPDVRSIVKSKYYDHKILRVQEIKTIDANDMPTYLVYIELGNDFKIVRVRDREMDVYQEFKRQN